VKKIRKKFIPPGGSWEWIHTLKTPGELGFGWCQNTLSGQEESLSGGFQFDGKGLLFALSFIF
jgi:hypothetical protein